VPNHYNGATCQIVDETDFYFNAHNSFILFCVSSLDFILQCFHAVGWAIFRLHVWRLTERYTCTCYVECTVCVRRVSADGIDDVIAYDFDLQFSARRLRGTGSTASTLDWVLPAAQSGFSACLWLATQTEGTILSLSGSQRALVAPHGELSQDDRYDVVVTVDRRPVERLPE